MIRERLKNRRDTQPPVAKQPRPRGIGTPITPEWKALVQRELDVRGMKRMELATLVGVTPGAITIFFRAATKTCRFVPELCRVLDLPPPEFLDVRDEEAVQLLRRLRRENPAAFDRIVARARAELEK